MSNYRRVDTPGATYFFTVVTFWRRNILTDDDCRIWLRNAAGRVGILFMPTKTHKRTSTWQKHKPKSNDDEFE